MCRYLLIGMSTSYPSSAKLLLFSIGRFSATTEKKGEEKKAAARMNRKFEAQATVLILITVP